MLVSQHAALSALAALTAAPLVKNKANLGLFWAAAVGQDVDHYLWHALKFHNPSLRDAYSFFRSRYGKAWHERGLRKEDARALHGPLPLAFAVALALADRRLAPIAAGMAFHGLLDALQERVITPATYHVARPALGTVGPPRPVERGEAERAA